MFHHGVNCLSQLDHVIATIQVFDGLTCWHLEVCITGSQTWLSVRIPVEHLMKIQIPRPHCTFMALWVFSGIVLKAVAGNHL